MLLVVGLGNPGPRHADNRHNYGFMAVDEIVRRHEFEPWRLRFQGRTSEGRIGAGRVLCLKPETYMNESGRAVGEVTRFFKLSNESVIVLHDDLDLALGRIKVKRGGGTGGNNGLRSIDAHIGIDYWRMRLGIGHPGDRARVHDYVLQDFAKTERNTAEKLIDEIATQFPQLVAGDFNGFMSRVAQAMAPPRPKPAERPPETRNPDDGTESG